MIGRLLSVGGFTALSRIAGFARDVVMAAVLGAGPLSDAFVVALRLPNHFRAVFAEGAFTAAFVPRYAAAAATEGHGPGSPAAAFANEVFAWQFAAQVALLIAALVFMPWVIAVLAPGFAGEPEQFALAVELTRITFPYSMAVAVVTQLSVMLNAIGRFRAAAAAPIFFSLSIIAGLFAADYFSTPAHAAAVGVLAAGVFELLLLFWASARAGLWLKFTRPRWSPRIGEFFRALTAAATGAGSVQIGLFIDTIIASFLPSGDLTSLYYADRINQLPMGIVGVALGTVLLPEMSTRLAAGDEKGAYVAQNRAVVFGLLFTLPCLAAFLVMPEIIMRALFARGAFGVEAAGTSALALMAYGIGLPAFVLVRCVVPSFYARGDTATPVRATLLSVAAGIAAKLVLVWGLSYGAAGLALGTSLGAWINLAVLILLARRRGVLVVTAELKRAGVPVAVIVALTALGFFAGTAVAPALLADGALAQEGTFLLAAALGGAAFTASAIVFRGRLPLREAIRHTS